MLEYCPFAAARTFFSVSPRYTATRPIAPTLHEFGLSFLDPSYDDKRNFKPQSPSRFPSDPKNLLLHAQ
jgi:hypothetical protein